MGKNDPSIPYAYGSFFVLGVVYRTYRYLYYVHTFKIQVPVLITP